MKFPNHRQNISLMLLITCVLSQINGQCYEYQKGDTYPDLNTSYCQSIIKWPVSSQTFTTFESRDQQALNNYTSLYKDYYQQGLVTVDCLGMAKYFFCAKAYPTCTEGQSQINAVCSWMCQLFSVRCGQNNIFYQQICLNQSVADSDCSFGGKIQVFFLLILMLIMITF